MKSTKSNLLIFVMANAEHGSDGLICHSLPGHHLLNKMAPIKFKLVQARFFKNRMERWQYLKSKNPDLELIEEMMK